MGRKIFGRISFSPISFPPDRPIVQSSDWPSFLMHPGEAQEMRQFSVYVSKKTSFTSQCRIKSSLHYSFWMLPEDAAVQRERLWRRTKQGLFGSGPAGNAARAASETRAPSPDTTFPVPKADVPNPWGPSPPDDAGGSRLRQQVPESPCMRWNHPSDLRQWQGNERSPERGHQPSGLRQGSGRSGFQTGPPACSLPPPPATPRAATPGHRTLPPRGLEPPYPARLQSYSPDREVPATATAVAAGP